MRTKPSTELERKKKQRDRWISNIICGRHQWLRQQGLLTVDEESSHSKLEEQNNVKENLSLKTHGDLFQLDREVTRLRAFQIPSAEADFDFYGRCPIWRVEEIPALLLGLEPKRFKWVNIKEHVDDSHIDKSYSDIRDLLMRGIGAGTFGPITITKSTNLEWTSFPPIQVLNWAINNNFVLPAELIEKVRLYHEKPSKEPNESTPREKELERQITILENNITQLRGEIASENNKVEKSDYPKVIQIMMEAYEAVYRQRLHGTNATNAKMFEEFMSIHYPKIDIKNAAWKSYIANFINPESSHNTDLG